MQAGLDSLGAVELRNALTAEFGIAVSATVAFDHPTPRSSGCACGHHTGASLGNTQPFEVIFLQHVTLVLHLDMFTHSHGHKISDARGGKHDAIS